MSTLRYYLSANIQTPRFEEPEDKPQVTQHKTYDEWKEAGFQVRLGSKRVGRDAQTGKAIFSAEQVDPIRKPLPRRNSYLHDFPTARYAHHQDRYADYDYEGSMEEQLGSSWDFRD